MGEKGRRAWQGYQTERAMMGEITSCRHVVDGHRVERKEGRKEALQGGEPARHRLSHARSEEDRH